MRNGFVDTSLLRTVTKHSAITKMQAIAIVAIIVIAAIVGGSYYFMAPAPKKEVTINIFVPTLPELPVIKAALPEFEKETGIKVTVEATEQTALIAKAIVAFQGKTGAYDLVISNAYGMGAYKPYAEPLDEYIQKYKFDKTRYFERLMNFYNFDGKQLGLPIIVTGRLMFYNQELLSKYNKSIPKTYDEVLQTARFFTKKFNPNSPTEFGIAFGGIRFYLDIGWKAALWAHGGEWSDRNWNPKFNSPEGVAALQYFVDLAECAPPELRPSRSRSRLHIS